MNNSKGLKIIHLNIRSLVPKMYLLRSWVAQHNPNIITLSETWLNSNISDNEIKLENYVLYRADRGSRGGGVATYVSSNLTAELITPTVKPTHFECLFVKIIFHQNKYITVGNVYRPPSAPVESSKCLMSTFDAIPFKNERINLCDFNKNWLDKSSGKDKAGLFVVIKRTLKNYI